MRKSFVPGPSSPNRLIDLNTDTGEDPQAIIDGRQEALFRHVSSVNVACGGHAGNDDTMTATLKMAKKYHRAAGAHPGFPDRENFGRKLVTTDPNEISNFVGAQIQRLAGLASQEGIELVHVKPHGALYNAAVTDEKIAEAIATGVSRFSMKLILVGMAGSIMLDVFQSLGFQTAAEAFADRAYDSPLKLKSRHDPGSILTEPSACLAQALAMAPQADTLCVHGDTPGAAMIASELEAGLTKAGFRVRPLGPA